MYPQNGAPVAPPQKPETFMLSSEAQQRLPQDAQVALQQVDNLKYFLISAPVDWAADQLIRRFLLPTGDYVSCVLWNNLFHVSGTDIVRCLSFRFQAFGRPVKNSKKFEEGIFSDLRNLKSGTDASLEEPKSPFLDFLYKNNCIRTQKKQKVFYWYSVPHDRLFLDALERDLKREKMGQEPTTVAVNEPALSFEFDSSHSLYDQITKAQQANTSSFSAHAAAAAAGPSHAPHPATYGSHSSSPMVRPTDSMPPPPPGPQHHMGPPAMPVVPEEANDPVMYNPVGLAASTSVSNSMIKAEQDFAGALQYDRNGIPVSRVHQRHASMPTYVEYSPAPSFVSSQYDDYGNRGLSFEPVTPPQHTVGLGSEPAYIANEDTGLYSAIPEIGSMGGFNPGMQLPPSNFGGPQLSHPSRSFPSAHVYSVLEGSPTYKQRRRRSSIPTSVTNAIAAATGNTSAQPQQRTSHQNTPQPHAAHRPSDLRRSCSVAQVPEEESSTQDALPDLTNSYTPQGTDSRHSVSQAETPLPSLVDDAASSHDRLNSMLNAAQSDPSSLVHGDNMEGAAAAAAALSSSANSGHGDRPGPVRRARSATMTELGPYPQKSHSCPIPSCGRLFKRLEHLKRHVRTHTQERPYLCPYCNRPFSRSDNLAQHRRIHEQQSGQHPPHQLSDDNNEPENHEDADQDPEHDLGDHSDSLGDNESPPSDSNSNPLPTTVNMSSVTSIPQPSSSAGSAMGLPQNMPSMVPPMMISPQLLQQNI